MWGSFFQFLLSHDLQAKAVEVIRGAIDRFLPNDELLKLVLADFLEETQNLRGADDLYRNLLTNSSRGGSRIVKTSNRDEDSGPSAIILIYYLSYVRRNYGQSVWKRAFGGLRVKYNLPWEVFLFVAMTEWRLCKNSTAALEVLQHGMEKYYLEARFISSYSDVLLDMGSLENARQVLCRGVTDLHRETGVCSRLLWTKWIRLEHRFGTKASLRSVEFLRSCQKMNICVEEEILQNPLIFSQNVDKNQSINASYGAETVAAITAQTKMFGGGDSFTELYERYRFGHLHPKTSMSETLGHRDNDPVQLEDRNEAVIGQEAENGAEDIEESETRRPSNIVVRPDVTVMTAFKPALSSMMTNPKDYELIGNVVVPIVPKGLQNLLNLLPTPPPGSEMRSRNASLVGYLINTLQSATIPPISLVDHVSISSIPRRS